VSDLTKADRAADRVRAAVNAHRAWELDQDLRDLLGAYDELRAAVPDLPPAETTLTHAAFTSLLAHPIGEQVTVGLRDGTRLAAPMIDRGIRRAAGAAGSFSLVHVTLAVPQGDPPPQACGRCHNPFDPSDARPFGTAQQGRSGFCRRCVDECHEAGIGHRCVICGRDPVPRSAEVT
jgi:hypothetical protein